MHSRVAAASRCSGIHCQPATSGEGEEAATAVGLYGFLGMGCEVHGDEKNCWTA